MAGYLTTHVLDTAHGCPGEGIRLELYRVTDQGMEKIKEALTNDDGRVDSPLLAESEFVTGRYQLVFYVADYYRSKGVVLDEPAFVDDVVIRFGIADPQSHYHVPLLVSPYSFSTYRGS